MTVGEQQELLTLAALLREGLLAKPPAAYTNAERLRLGGAVAKRTRPKATSL